MAENSKIEWATHTFNPWMGCTKVSPACKNCYAERDMDHRYGKVGWGPTGTRVLTSNENWAQPLKWNRDAEASGVRARVFCASLADVFEDWQGPILNSKGERLWIDTASAAWLFASKEDSERSELARQKGVAAGTMNDVRKRLFALIDATPNLDWLLLTKRPENIEKMWPAIGFPESGVTGTLGRHLHLANVWLGTSVENQEFADKRIPELLKCRDLSPVLFLSCEPLLGPVDLNADGGWLVPWEKSDGVCGPDAWNEMFVCAKNHSAKRYLKSEKHGRNICLQSGCEATVYPAKPGINWVIAGGESGPEARPSDPEWFRSIRDQCKACSVPFLFKQWGEHDEKLCRVGKSKAGRMLDEVLHDEFPKSSPSPRTA